MSPVVSCVMTRTCDAYHRRRRPADRGISYAAVVAPLPASARALLTSGALAHCVTLNVDGSPQVSAVWIGVEDTADGERIVMAHIPRNAKIRNLDVSAAQAAPT